jgi:hypothetical protein
MTRLVARISAAMVVAGLSWISPPVQAADMAPADPQPAADSLQPGLAVEYAYVMTRTVDDVATEKGFSEGKPLTGLNYRTGEDMVLTSNHSDGVLARIHGFINLPQPGRYVFALESNDGVRLWLNDAQVLEDDGVHADQFSGNAEIIAAQAGWYKLDLHYFERKSTATLRLHWKTPGAEKFVVVPNEQFAFAKR